MVAVATTTRSATAMGWLYEMSSRMGHPLHHKKPTPHLGILSFEAAKTMSRLVSLYRSLSDHEISNLKENLVKSQGVAYLNSKDEDYLLGFAFSERLESLDKVAAAVGRLGQKCTDLGLVLFDTVYSDMKMGGVNMVKAEYGTKDSEKRIQKMDKLINATSDLYASLEALTELEVSERKLNEWKKHQKEKMNFDLFYQKIATQRKQVRHFREISLWAQTFDRTVGLMARMVCIVYVRLCSILGPSEPILKQVLYRSGPIVSTTEKPNILRFYTRKSVGDKRNNEYNDVRPWTVGGSGLALRYAHLVLFVERYLDKAVTIDNTARDNLYEMLPDNLRASVKLKLGKNARSMGNDDDRLLAEGWREALAGIMGWLAPMAHDTVKWHLERNYEKMKVESKPTVLLLQTLHFADKVKTEAAIAEVLVGLSCVYRYENRLFV